MKINEKTLINYCTSNTPTDREGWLVKRGEVNKSFQKRWCVLKGNLLFYSEKQGDREPLGVIILEGCTVELAEEETDVFAFKIIFHGEGKTQGRVYILGSNTMEDLEAWMKLIACASYDYMKLMVVELQQQLAELEERDKLKQSRPEAPPRNRSNPFNTTHTRRKTWLELHQTVGQQIAADKELWVRKVSVSQASQSSSPTERERSSEEPVVRMKDDNLLVAI